MRISLKKIVHDIRGLANEFPEPYTYAVILQASDKVAQHAAAANPDLKGRAEAFHTEAEKFVERMQEDPLESWKKAFFLLIQKPWNMINSASKIVLKEDQKDFLNGATELFWNTAGAEDKKAQEEKKLRRYGFWPVFLLGAAAVGGIFAYSAGKSTKEYIEEKQEKTSPYVYAGIGAIAVLGLAALMKR